MTLAHARYRRLLSGAMMMSLTTLSGCQKLTPNGQPSTMTMLRSGSEKVCTAPDVQQALHDLIVPKVADIEGEASIEDKQSAVDTLRLTYDLTTLQSFDQAVSRASCETTIRIAGADGKSDKFNLDYQVSPSAEDPNTFVVTTRSPDAGSYARESVDAAVQAAAADRQAAQEDAEEKQAKAQLLAVITPRWLVGTWITTTADATNCADERALTFSANHAFNSQGHTGRWALNANELHLVGNGPSGSVDDTSTITKADAVSFTTATTDNNSVTWRRCTRAETEAPGSEPTISASELNLEAPR